MRRVAYIFILLSRYDVNYANHMITKMKSSAIDLKFELDLEFEINNIK